MVHFIFNKLFRALWHSRIKKQLPGFVVCFDDDDNSRNEVISFYHTGKKMMIYILPVKLFMSVIVDDLFSGLSPEIIGSTA